MRFKRPETDSHPRFMESSDAPHTAPEEPHGPRIGPSEIFLTFSSLALSGFGGVMPFAYRTLVERRKWVSDREFAELLAIAQVLPGPTVGNLSVMIGQRYAGFPGACAALAGMVVGPFCIIIALGIAWQRFSDVTSVKRALGGMSAVAIGLILATAAKLGTALFKSEAREPPEVGPVAVAVAVVSPALEQTTTGSSPSWWTMRRLARMALCALAFAGVGMLRWPLAAVVASLAPFAIALSWFGDR